MENRNGYHKQNYSALRRSFGDGDGDLEEADVWEVLKETKDSDYSFGIIESPFQLQRSLNMPSAARIIPRTSNSSSSSSSSSNSNSTTDRLVRHQQRSAPVKISDWSNISNRKSKKKAYNNENNQSDDGGGVGDDGEDDVDDDSTVPPHEIIAERLAKSQISSFSVFEGVGRTLKGRDLSKVRNAVLTRTGFLEP